MLHAARPESRIPESRGSREQYILDNLPKQLHSKRHHGQPVDQKRLNDGSFFLEEPGEHFVSLEYARKGDSRGGSGHGSVKCYSHAFLPLRHPVRSLLSIGNSSDFYRSPISYRRAFFVFGAAQKSRFPESQSEIRPSIRLVRLNSLLSRYFYFPGRFLNNYPTNYCP